MIGYILDLDGTLLNGSEAFEGARDFVQYLQAGEIPFLIMTNSVQKPSRILERLSLNGINVLEDQILNPITAINQWLQKRGYSRPYIVGDIEERSQVIFDHVEMEADCILLLDFEDINVDYETLNHIMLMMRKGVPSLAASRSAFYQKSNLWRIDTGAFVRLLEAASERDILVMGKPSADYFEMGIERLGCDSDETVIIGDDIQTDMLGAHIMGAKGILLRTGKYVRDDELKGLNILCLDTLRDLLEKCIEGDL